MTTTRPARVRCPLGGFAPCIDDLCNGSDETLCGLERGFDFCDHGYDPEECPDCRHDGDWDGDWADDQEQAQEAGE